MKIECHQQAWNILLYFYNCNSLQCFRKLLNISEIVCRILKNFLYMPHFPLISRGYCFFSFATRKEFFQGYRQKIWNCAIFLLENIRSSLTYISILIPTKITITRSKQQEKKKNISSACRISIIRFSYHNGEGHLKPPCM